MFYKYIICVYFLNDNNKIYLHHEIYKYEYQYTISHKIHAQLTHTTIHTLIRLYLPKSTAAFI